MTSTDPARLRAREEGLTKVRHATAWCASLAVVASGVAAGALGAAIPGHSAHTTSSSTSTSKGSSSSSTSTSTSGTTGSSSTTGDTGASTAPSVQMPVASSSPS